MEEKEVKERTFLVNDREIKLKCPVCGCEKFAYKYIWMDVHELRLDFGENFWTFICNDCSHVLWFKKAPRTENWDDPVENWKRKFIRLGYHINEALLMNVISSTDEYEAEAVEAAKILLHELKGGID